MTPEQERDENSLRDFFAAASLIGRRAAEEVRREFGVNVARECYRDADAMLDERKKPRE